MKAQLRIATKDPFCYIEATCEGSPEEIVEQYGEMYRAYWVRTKVGDGLEKKVFDAMLDTYLWHGGSWSDSTFSQLNEEQQTIVQAIKRSKARESRAANKTEKANTNHLKDLQ